MSVANRISELEVCFPPVPTGGTFDTLRHAALSLAQRLGVPEGGHEEWKYTPIRHKVRLGFVPGSAHANVTAATDPFDFEKIKFTFVNGVFSVEHSSIEAVEGFHWDLLSGEVSDAARELVGSRANLEAERFDVAAHFGGIERPAIHALAAANTMSFVDGIAIRIDRNVKIEKPIYLEFLSAGDRMTSCPRVAIRLAEGAEATVIQSYRSAATTDATFTNAVSEAVVDPNAKLTQILIQDQSMDSTYVHLCEVNQATDSWYENFNVGFGSSLARTDINVFVNGSQCHTRLDGIVCARDEQLIDNHTRLDHVLPHCESYENYKHLVDNNGTAVFNGKIFVHQDAQKTDAKQTNQTLLLSPSATINTKPQLEIFADDVKCTHGATIGQLREDALFYLMSRGISTADARAILVYAFAAEVLERIEHAELRDILERRLYEILS